ncbi:uncharacterized protein LOC135849790 [Planococcus citri]|uniref:uncharacterized protein LOC135849790 n=1 Tax=Planococcus citri TaxID=170843 RepID=UPI0031F8792F
MDYNKTTILKETRELLQTLRCEIVVDISDSQLFNVLFQSDVKKETLLKWLLQQMYPLEVCTNTPLDDLISTFIPKAQFRSFLIGTMPIAEQYKKWRLIMTILDKKQRRQNYLEEIDYEKELLNGSILEKHDSFWAEKVGFSPKYFISPQDNLKKANDNELKTDLDKLKQLLAEVKSKKKSNEKRLSSMENKVSSVMEQYKRSSESFSETVAQDLLPQLNTSTNQTEKFTFRYDSMNSDALKNVAKKVNSLQEKMETLNNALQGVNKIQN